MQEPSDEMLSAIMREAAEDAKQSTDAAESRFFGEISQMVEETLRKYKVAVL